MVLGAFMGRAGGLWGEGVRLKSDGSFIRFLD